jgi:putative peptidoglycan lipid II flippase
VILPHLSRRFAAQDQAGYSRSLDWGLRLVLLVGWPAGLGLMFLAEPITASVYNYGRFTAHDTEMAAWSLIAMSIGVPAFMASKVLLPAFYARQDTKTPMRAALWTVGSNVGLTLLIVTPLAMNHVVGGHAGIALATGLAGVVNAVWLFVALRRQRIFTAQAGWPAYLLKLLAAGAAMVATLIALRAWVGDWTALHALQRIVWLLVAVGAGALTYGLVLLALGLRPRHVRDRG